MPYKKRKYIPWKHGQKKELSVRTGILQSYISGIFNRKEKCGRKAAQKIMKAAEEMGLTLTLGDLILHSDTTPNPLFAPLTSALTPETSHDENK